MEIIQNIKNITPVYNKKMENKRAYKTVNDAKTEGKTEEIKKQNIIQVSTNPEFYKNFTFNKFTISVYKNVKEKQEHLLIITINKNSYYIKMGCAANIENIEDFTQTLLEDINKDIFNNNIEQLNKHLINSLLRDSKQDIVYNPENPHTRLKNYPLFYFTDSKNNIFVAYNKALVDTKTIKLFTTKEDNGCLIFLSNTNNYSSLDFKTYKERILFYLLFNKTWYEDKNIIETQGF